MTYQQLLKQTQSLSLEDQQRLMFFLYKKFGSTRKYKPKATKKEKTVVSSAKQGLQQLQNICPTKSFSYTKDDFYSQ